MTAVAPRAFPLESLDRLADDITRGDVVFFIGAGFSVDSEGNTATRLVYRLLLRLLALEQLVPLARDLRTELKHTFELEVKPADGAAPATFPFTKADADKLAGRYYETNEWFCTAFARLVHDLVAQPPVAGANATAAALARIEREIRAQAPLDPKVKLADISLQSADDLSTLLPALLAWAARAEESEQASADVWRYAGKALFLDTLGFRDPLIMAGYPDHADPRAVAASYGGRLLPRHYVVARFAREGLCTTTLTANYDLLLEGAFRLSGFRLSGGAGPGTSDEHVPATTFAEVARIASPAEFFSEGKAHRTSVLVKMHGCVSSYRACRYTDDGRRLMDYLPSMVFTYREIQNWRGDSWAADFLRTLLRTRTVVFAGYSVQDPVIHDTFRTVYEEMAVESARSRRTRPSPADEKVKPERAPAYFFAPGVESREFYGMEVLQAASAAVGARRAVADHPNYVRFYYRNAAEFPNVDELFVWLQHRVTRLHQAGCFETHLRRMITIVLGKPRPPEELAAVRARFEELVRRERAVARGWDNTGRSPGRHQHGRVCGWTDSFHTGLLREFAALDLLQDQRGPGARLARLRRSPWYYPASQDARWTCWAAVVELAIRRMTRVALGLADDVPDHEFVWCARAPVPTVLFAPKGHAPHALAIYVGGFDPEAQLARIDGNAVRHCSWQLTSGDALWRRQGCLDAPARPQSRWASRTTLAPPPAPVLWHWASAPASALSAEDAARWLGGLPRSAS
jgi:hypothetical protein